LAKGKFCLNLKKVLLTLIKFEKSFVDPGGFWLSYPSALRKRLMHFPFEIIIMGYQGILEYCSILGYL
jgi:hypothetical protein